MTRDLRQIEEAAAWAVSFRLDTAPADVIALAKLQTANILAAVFAGSRCAAGVHAYRASRAIPSTGPCTLIPHGEPASLWDALFLHAVYANALELDDFLFRGHLGPASAIVPLTLGEAVGASAHDALRAQIVANELGGRLGWSITAEIRHGHQRSYLVRFAAAAAAGILLGLDERQFAHALAAAMTQPETALHRGMFSAETKTHSAASAVTEGVRSAFLAREGATAALDILEHPAGFYRQFSMHRSVRSPFVQFGEAWCTHALSFRRYPSCGVASGAIHAALAVRRDPHFALEAISSISVEAGITALIMERLSLPHEPGVLTPVNVQFSILRSVCGALALGDLRGGDYRPNRFAVLAAHIERLEPLCRLTHDWEFTLDVLRGIDAGLPDGGGGPSADMFQFYRTSSEFHRLFGSARAIGLRDFGRLLMLPASSKRFFVGRWLRSVSNHFGKGRRADRPFVGDLRRLEWRTSARVTVRLANGRSISAECKIAPGIAPDPGRADVVREKLQVEGADVIGADAAAALWEVIHTTGTIGVAKIVERASPGVGVTA